MPFHFSLEAVLRSRRGQERMERLKLESISSELAQARARLEDMKESNLVLRRRLQQDLANTMSGSELQFEATRAARAAYAYTALRARLADLEVHRIAQLQVYMKVRQSREAFEIVLKRQLHFYRLEQSRHEQQDLDDLFLMRQGIAPDE
jgi:flagellar export protein FliJ